MKMNLHSLFPRKKPNFSRSARRYSCQIEGSLVVIDKMVTYEGRVTDFSIGGALFRPRLAYLMDRRDVPVCLVVGDVQVAGRIVNTTPAGFGVSFDQPLEEEEVMKLLNRDRKHQSVTEDEFFDMS